MSILSFTLTFLYYACLLLGIIIAPLFVGLLVILSVDMGIAYRNEGRVEKQKEAARSIEHSRDMMRKEALRREKEAQANEGFFEDSYIPGFDANGVLVHHLKVMPTVKAKQHYRLMDDLSNACQADNVEKIQSDLAKPKDH